MERASEIIRRGGCRALLVGCTIAAIVANGAPARAQAEPARSAPAEADPAPAVVPEADPAPAVVPEPQPSASAEAAPAPAVAPEPEPAFPPGVLRFYGGFGALLSGGAVSATGAGPDLGAHARGLSDLLGIDVGVRPFLGGAIIALSARVSLGTDLDELGIAAALQLEYDVIGLFDGSPLRRVALALGGSLGIAAAYSRYAAVTPPPRAPDYWILRPEWRLYLEGRYRVHASHFALARVEMTTGFDDFTHLTQVTLDVGYQWGFTP